MISVKGWHGHIDFDGQQVTVHKTMRGSTSIPLQQIGGVEIVRAGIGMHVIRFAAPGGTTGVRQLPLGSHKEAARDPYALTFRSGRRKEFEQFRDQVLDRMRMNGGGP